MVHKTEKITDFMAERLNENVCYLMSKNAGKELSIKNGLEDGTVELNVDGYSHVYSPTEALSYMEGFYDALNVRKYAYIVSYDSDTVQCTCASIHYSLYAAWKSIHHYVQNERDSHLSDNYQESNDIWQLVTFLGNDIVTTYKINKLFFND